MFTEDGKRRDGRDRSGAKSASGPSASSPDGAGESRSAARQPASAPPRREQSGPLRTNLERFVEFTPEEVRTLERLSVSPQSFKAGQTILHEGSNPDCICMIVQGVAYRYKLLASGRRQILGYIIPGDLCDTNFIVFNQLDYSVTALGDCLVASIPIRDLKQLVAQSPNVERALLQAALVDVAILREWLANVGQRNAYQRLSHFFCEMFVRLKAVGLAAGDGSVELPINQAVLADTTGLTPVHVNRIVQRLRKEQLIELRRHHLVIADPRRLAEVAGFDDNYLTVQRID